MTASILSPSVLAQRLFAAMVAALRGLGYREPDHRKPKKPRSKFEDLC